MSVSNETLSGSDQLVFNWSHCGTVGALGTVGGQINQNRKTTWTNGNGSAPTDIDQETAGTRTLAAGAQENISLNATLFGLLGDQFNPAKIKKLFLELPAQAANGSTQIQFNTSITNGWTSLFNGTLELPAGGNINAVIPNVNGLPVVNGTCDLINVKNLDNINAAIYNIGILGY